MKKYKHHNEYFDDIDMKRMATKSYKIKKIISWLNRLIELDSSIDKAEVVDAIEMLKNKQETLDKKYQEAQEDMIEEAELLASVYDED